MSDLLPYIQLVAGTDKGFVDAADRQESALLTGERGDIRGEQRSVEAYYLQGTRLESIAERKSRRRRLTEDGNVEISGRYLGRVPDDGGADRPGASQFGPKLPFQAHPLQSRPAPEFVELDLGRWGTQLRRGRAHKTDRNPIGIFDDRVSRPPEGVIGRLESCVAGAGQICVRGVDGIAR